MLEFLKYWKGEIGLILVLLGLAIVGIYFGKPMLDLLAYQSAGVGRNFDYWDFFLYFLIDPVTVVHNNSGSIMIWFYRNNTLLGLGLFVLGLFLRREKTKSKKKRRWKLPSIWDRTED